jgi:arsenical pump membrane protein
MTVSFANIMTNLTGTNLNAAIYATSIGSNLGACITPIGALAGIMWMNILKEKKIKFSFLDFTRYGIIITLFTLAASLLVLAAEFYIF